MKKKTILIAAYNLDFGGIEKSLINLLKNIDYNKYKVSIVLEKKEGVFLNNVPKDVSIREYNVSNNKIVLVRKILNFFKQFKWKIFNNNKYDVAICYATYSKPCSFIARCSSTKTILFVHSNYYQLYDKDELKVKEFFDGIKIQSFGSIVFVSNESRNDLCNIYDISKKSFVINNLVDYERIVELSKAKTEIPKISSKVFIFVGRLEEKSKKISRILHVANMCKKEKINASFWIVGDGPDKKEYLRFKKEYNLSNVLFFGSRKNPYPYMRKADYLILTSSYEGFPVVYNEAIVLKKYILTTIDVSDDFITIPNRFGIVVNEDVNDIFNKVVYLSLNDVRIEEQVDFQELNRKRIKKIEKMMEKEDD